MAGGGFRYTPWAESLGPPLATQRVLLVGDPREAVLEVEPVTRIFQDTILLPLDDVLCRRRSDPLSSEL